MASYDVDMHDSDDDDVRVRGRDQRARGGTQRNGGKGAASQASSAPKEPRARWEAMSTRNWDLQEGADGSLEGVLQGREEAQKRARLQKDTTPLQRGIIRHTLLVIDLSAAMQEKDLRPSRFLLTLTYVVAFVREFFEQNPISQLGILGMRDGLAVRISDMSGNPTAHINAVKGLRADRFEPKGNPSLQNALEMARAALYHTPSHGTREVVIILGALQTSDPGDIHDTIKACIRDRIRVAIIGLSAQLHICALICAKTNAGDTSAYNIATDEVQYRELLMRITTPPVVRTDTTTTTTGSSTTNKPSSSSGPSAGGAALLMMGFPSRIPPSQTPTLCACHGTLTRTGYLCSRCNAKICALPATCPACDLTLILSTHLARSYHHLFPLRGWVEVSWRRAREVGARQCFGCLAAFPVPPPEPGAAAGGGAKAQVNGEKGRGGGAAERAKRADGASESSRYECETCERHFCVDCDVFCHEVVHNCPGCQSSDYLPGAEAEEEGQNEQGGMVVDADAANGASRG